MNTAEHVIEIYIFNTKKSTYYICELPDEDTTHQALIDDCHKALIAQGLTDYKIERVFRLRADYRIQSLPLVFRKNMPRSSICPRKCCKCVNTNCATHPINNPTESDERGIDSGGHM